MTGTGTVLVVDDRPADRGLLRKLLEHRGHRVVEAADGAEALRAIAAERPAVVVSDILLPGIGGYELVLRLRDDPATADLPVILCSAHFGPWEMAGVAPAIGAAAVLAKPVEAEELFRVVDACLAIPPAGGPERRRGDRRLVTPAPAAVPPELVELLTGKLFEKVQQLEMLSGDRQALVGFLVASQEEERRRVATALHDDAVQVLFGGAFMLQALVRRDLDPELALSIRDIARDLTVAGERLGRLMNDLQPPSIGGQTLATVLSRAVARAGAAGGFRGTVIGSLAADPAADQFTVVYRIAQEALANVVHHARASRVILTVDDHDGGVLVTVEDDGVGLPAGGPRPGAPGLGLTAMRERAELAGGWWRIHSAPQASGTTVEYWIPLEIA